VLTLVLRKPDWICLQYYLQRLEAHVIGRGHGGPSGICTMLPSAEIDKLNTTLSKASAYYCPPPPLHLEQTHEIQALWTS
jgi:hypothetical protein